MEAKLKAEELVLKFLRIENNTPEWFNTHIAKQCALIAVDEIIENLVDLSDEEFTFIYDVEYWQQVKTEINKL
jgi:hypothetical protein